MYGLWGWGCTGALCALLGVASPPRAEPAGLSPVRLDRIVDSAAARGFSGHVLVGAIPPAGASASAPPAVLYERVVGLADRARGRPIRVGDAWRWASVTKQVTAALVMQQVDSGRIALDEPVTRYLPDFAGPTGSAVTVRRLLQHTSELPNPSDTPRDGSPVVGYEGDGRPEPAFELATFGAAGALNGTARDLLAFNHSLVGHRLVSPASTAEMWRGDPRLGYAALGAWSFPAALRGCAEPVRLIERRGAIGGIQVRNVIAPERGALIVFTNSAAVEFGEIWQGAGLSDDLLSVALCGDPA